MFTVRKTTISDFTAIHNLYRKVAERTVGIARSAEEISENYVKSFMDNASEHGIELVVEHPENKSEIIAEIHCYMLTPKVFRHVLSELTIVADPDFHGIGVGKTIFTALLEYINAERPDILRVELIARESNVKAIRFYESLGFKIEGRLENRILSSDGSLEADIPMAWFNPSFLKIKR